MKRIILIAILVFVPSLYAAFQLELKGYDVLGETRPGNGKFNSNGAAVTGNLYGSFDLSPKLQLFLIEDLDDCIRLSYTQPGVSPVEKISPFYEKEIPSSNNIEAGLRYSGLGVWNLRFKNRWYFDALPIYPDYLQTQYTPADSLTYIHASDKITRHYRNDLNASWLLPVNGFSLYADVNYFGLDYSLDQMGLNLNNFPPTDTVFSSFGDVYSDLWSRLDIGYDFSESFGVTAGALSKNDLSGNPDYSLYRYSVQLKGAQEFPSDNRFAWNLAGRWYENRIMQENGFAVGPGAILYLRDAYTITQGLFLKGLACLEVGHNLYKQRLECSLRKAWDNESFLESGYFSNQGGLFPTQGFYARSKVYIVRPFSVALNLKSVWEGPDNIKHNKLATQDVVSYIKTAGNFELAYAIVRQCELLSGLDYTYYNAAVFKDPDFPSRGGVYLGVRMWFR